MGAVLAAVVVVALVAGFVVLTLKGKDVGPYALILAGPLVTSVVGALIATRVKAVESVVQVVERQTNGAMSEQFAGVHDHLDAQTVTLITDRDPPTSGHGAARPAGPQLPTPRQSVRDVLADRQTARDAQVSGPIRPSTDSP